MSQIPPIAAKWIANSVLPHQSSLENNLQSRGLEFLSVQQLKAVGEAIQRKNYQFRVPSSAKKAQRVMALRNFFYSDPPICSQVNRTIMDMFQEDLRVRNNKRPAEQISHHHQQQPPQQQQQQNRAVSNHDPHQLLLQSLGLLPQPYAAGPPLIGGVNPWENLTASANNTNRNLQTTTTTAAAAAGTATST